MKKITLLLSLISTTGFAQISVNLQHVTSYSTGVFDDSGAEILAYDANSKTLFYTNAADNEIGLLDITNLGNISKTEIALPPGGVNSVDFKNGYLAVALEDTNKQANGKILFYNTAGNLENSVIVGALPDMVTFSPDGNLVVSANEGEPNSDYSNDPLGTVSIVDISNGISNLTQSNVTTLDFSAYNSNIDTLVRINGNNGLSTVAQDLEPEYVAISNDSKTAYVTLQENNAFAVIDLDTKSITDVSGLGYKDWGKPSNQLDASDKRSKVHFSSYTNLFGMYMPDATKFFSVNGMNYLITANEGDGREYDNFEDEIKVSKVNLDSIAFPNYAVLQEDTVLGRLNISSTDGDKNNDGYYEKLYAFGGRSFSIWDADTRNLIYDSGDEIEKKVFAENPNHFNSTNDDNDSFKNRSDNKGSEPEAVEIATINGTTLAFVGLERQGGIMTFDVSTPSSPVLVGYTNHRDFSVSADSSAAGDLGPEDIVFIDANSSPNGKPLIAVANEVSGTVSIFEITSNYITVDENKIKSLEVYPNPTLGIVNTTEKGYYTVFDLNGNILIKTNNTNQIDLSKLATGMYLIKNSAGSYLRVIKE